MGFRQGGYMTVWSTETSKSGNTTRVRLSSSRKNKKTDEYEQDFSGFVLCIGTAAAGNALKLQEGSRIKLGDCDVSTKYDAEKKITYTNFKLFSFETEDGESSPANNTEPQPTVDEGEIDDSRLPF